MKNTFNIYKYGVLKTPLEKNYRLSKVYNSNIFFKREDLQLTNSYKIRPALFNFLFNLDKNKNIVIASAGNFSSGVAYWSNKFKINSKIFIPINTPKQKINNIWKYGKDYIKIKKVGKDFNECLNLSKKYCFENNLQFFHPFDSYYSILGNMTIIEEIIQEKKDIDYIIVPIGGGGLISGILLYVKKYYPHIKIIGCETYSTNSMYTSLYINRKISTKNINDNFVEGISVKKPGFYTFKICEKYLDNIILVDDNFLCKNIIDLYYHEKIIIEPAGCVSISSLEYLKEKIKNKNVVCILSGSNNDISRYSEILKRSSNYF